MNSNSIKVKIPVFLTWLLLTIVSAGICQSKSNTVFLKGGVVNGQGVYIDNNKNSIGYTCLKNMPKDTAGFARQVASIKDSFGLSIKPFPVAALLKSWFPLYQYNGKLYAYSPCDGGTTPWVRFYEHTMTDQYHDWTMMPSILTKVDLTKNGALVEFSNLVVGKSRIKIHFIESRPGMAVFERPDKNAGSRYTLMISEDRLTSYPVIVNSCPLDKKEEWTFDVIDYQKLLKQK